MSSRCPHNMVNFLTSGWDWFGSSEHPYEFQRVSRLGSVTAQYSSSGHRPNFVALNRGHHLYSEGRPSRWALAHILVMYVPLEWYEIKLGGKTAVLVSFSVLTMLVGDRKDICIKHFVSVLRNVWFYGLQRSKSHDWDLHRTKQSSRWCSTVQDNRETPISVKI